MLLELPHGVPSHDTFNRVLALLKPEALQARLFRCPWSVYDKTNGSRKECLIAIDDMSLRRTFDRAASQEMLHLVNAWLTANVIAPSQVAAEDKPNELIAIPTLLAAADISAATAKIDATGGQKDIVKAITSGDGDYCLAVKENREKTLRLLRESLSEHSESEASPSRDTQHGRRGQTPSLPRTVSRPSNTVIPAQWRTAWNHNIASFV